MQGQASLEDVDAIAVAALLFVEAPQHLERVGIFGVLVEDADAGGNGLLHVADIALEQVGDSPPQLLPGGRVAGEVDPLAQDLHALTVLRAGFENPVEDVDRLAILGSISKMARSVVTAASVSPRDFSSRPAIRNRIALRAADPSAQRTC